MTDFCVVSVIDLIILQIFFVMIHKPNRTINVKKNKSESSVHIKHQLLLQIHM